MGLRFRKSIKICDGLRLNFGKNGASVTVGSGPFKKTYNTNGNVTTTMGLPGTGIYWTETERRGSRNNRRNSSPRQTRESLDTLQNDYQVSSALDDYFLQSDASENVASTAVREAHIPASAQPPVSNTARVNSTESQPVVPVPETVTGLSAEAIKKLYVYADAPIDWTELIAGATAEDLLMDSVVHSYCAQMAPRILSGDVDAYLEVIERLRPVDDVALYSGDFEFGTDKPTYIEVEFVVNPDRVLRGGISDGMLEEFISAIAVRVARDLFALLPVRKVLVHVEITGNTVLSVILDRSQLCGINFKNISAKKVVREFPCHRLNNYLQLSNVERIQI